MAAAVFVGWDEAENMKSDAIRTTGNAAEFLQAEEIEDDLISGDTDYGDDYRGRTSHLKAS